MLRINTDTTDSYTRHSSPFPSRPCISSCCVSWHSFPLIRNATAHWEELIQPSKTIQDVYFPPSSLTLWQGHRPTAILQEVLGAAAATVWRPLSLYFYFIFLFSVSIQSILFLVIALTGENVFPSKSYPPFQIASCHNLYKFGVV